MMHGSEKRIEGVFEGVGENSKQARFERSEKEYETREIEELYITRIVCCDRRGERGGAVVF